MSYEENSQSNTSIPIWVFGCGDRYAVFHYTELWKYDKFLNNMSFICTYHIFGIGNRVE